MSLTPINAPDWYSEAMIQVIGSLRRLYEPRPTPWTGLDTQAAQQLAIDWINLFAAAGISADDVRAAAADWERGEEGQFFPSPQALIRIVHDATRERQRVDHIRDARPENAQCDGTGWTFRGG